MFGINACDIDTITVMSDAVNDCVSKRTGIIAELVIPFLEFSYWEQKIVEDFLRLRWSSSKISLCSESVGFNRSHSSRIRTTGLAYLAITFL